jgi:hypothetical protein
MREGRTQLFPLGRVSATHSARQAMLRLGIGPDAFVERHRRGDWGNVNAALVRENAVALKGGFRLLSAYGIGGEIF